MKTIATIALIMALLGFPASNANAYSFTLWEIFPQLAISDSYFAPAALDQLAGRLTFLDNPADYYYSRDGVVVARSAIEPWILMQPSSTEMAIFFGISPGSVTVNVDFQFGMVAGTSVTVSVGIANFTNSNDWQYIPLFSDNLDQSGSTTSSSLLNVSIDPWRALVFAVHQESDNPQVHLKGIIHTNPVTVPPSVLLLLTD